VFASGSTNLGGTLTAGAGVTIQSGAMVTGTATITATVTNSGTLIVAGNNQTGTLVINGDYYSGNKEDQVGRPCQAVCFTDRGAKKEVLLRAHLRPEGA
jgi:hypothetical protein